MGSIQWVGIKFKENQIHDFSRARDIELPQPLVISEVPFELVRDVRFLGVIINESLSWSQHIKTVQSKMACYVGIMYKIKKYLPLKARLQIHHSLVQSHVSYCSLVWGFSAKSCIEKIFIQQKK